MLVLHVQDFASRRTMTVAKVLWVVAVEEQRDEKKVFVHPTFRNMHCEVGLDA